MSATCQPQCWGRSQVDPSGERGNPGSERASSFPKAHLQLLEKELGKPVEYSGAPAQGSFTALPGQDMSPRKGQGPEWGGQEVRTGILSSAGFDEPWEKDPPLLQDSTTWWPSGSPPPSLLYSLIQRRSPCLCDQSLPRAFTTCAHQCDKNVVQCASHQVGTGGHTHTRYRAMMGGKEGMPQQLAWRR